MAGIRVAMVAQGFPVNKGIIDGGLASSTYYLAKALNAIEGVRVSVIRPYSSESNDRNTCIDGIEVISVATRSKWAALRDEPDRRAVLEVIEKISPDVVHFQALPRWANRCPFPSIVTIHGIAERDVLLKGSKSPLALIKYIILALGVGRARRAARYVIAISPYTRRYLGKTDGRKIWDIPNPVADDYFLVSRKVSPGRIFCSSKISPLKNTHRLIEAVSLLTRQNKDVELILAGSGENSPYAEKCRRTASKLGVADRVKYLGMVPISQVMAELSLANCFALCSLQENAPMSVAEAMAVGVPVVCGDVGALSWMTNSGTVGRLVNSSSALSIAEGILDILEKEPQDYGDSQIKSRARQMFDSNNIARKTLEAYRELLTEERLLPEKLQNINAGAK